MTQVYCEFLEEYMVDFGSDNEYTVAVRVSKDIRYSSPEMEGLAQELPFICLGTIPEAEEEQYALLTAWEVKAFQIIQSRVLSSLRQDSRCEIEKIHRDRANRGVPIL